ncbi:MAG TPA: CCA tRNA nucleotidyltransferase [Albidovulum sp.]|uniref:CCA tRNA nucleotidyltransferase n=1 Tax=Albidovulum sp. TaxID=1872424 RepID=UPI002CD7FEE0|nr:CCA tRNA nucleotidyltransferase [Albidovulum sp.]
MRIEGDWIKAPATQAVLAMLTGAGHQGWLVGGCVRDGLLGRAVADIDITTDARPARVVELAEAAGFRVVPTGIDHGTVTLIVGGTPHEVTTFRRDVETDGRRATVAFADGLEEDAARRDFTMNALYADANGEVTDPVGGLADLEARRIRFVGDAETRVREDYLRILRFFRFHASYGDPDAGMDAEALAAIAANSDGLDRLSKERIGHEMRRLLAAPDPAPALAAMQATGVLAHVLPGADPRALAPLVHLEPEGLAPGWLRRLAALGGDAEWLRLSKAEARELELLRAAIEGGAGPAELAYRHREVIARDAMLIRAASGLVLSPDWQDEIATGAAARFPLSAADLMPGLQGAALGQRLAELEARWIASGFTLSREQLLA